MLSMKTTFVIVIIVTSMACAIESRASRTTRRIPKEKEEQRPCKGKKCSISADAPAPNGGRIVGGTEAVPHSWPWMVLFLCGSPRQQISQKEICGASLISDRWIMTAAHCFYKTGIKPVTKYDVRHDCTVYLGKHERLVQEPTELIPTISDHFEHEKYIYPDFKNGYDIGLIKLAQPVDYTSAIKPISLPFGRPALPYNQSCIATGWGDTKYGGDPSEKLMQVPLSVMDETFCTREAIGHPDRMICTTSWSFNRNVCNGDSGGPLACKESDGKWYLRGVISHDMQKCMVSAQHTKVVFFEGWIKYIISHN